MTNIEDSRIIQNILLDAAAEEYAAELASTEEVTTSHTFNVR